jgi:hypothetical protein
MLEYSPGRSPLRGSNTESTTTPLVSRSPLIDRFSSSRSGGLVTHSGMSRMLDSAAATPNRSPQRHSSPLRPSLEVGERTPSAQHLEPNPSQPPKRPSVQRGFLSEVHQDRMQKSANKLLDHLNPDSPVRQMRISSPSRSMEASARQSSGSPKYINKSSATLKHNLQDIKSKLSSL